MRRIDFISLFPEVLQPALRHSILGRAASSGHVRFDTVNPRDFTYDRHSKVDDAPYGGEPGMLIRVDVVERALRSLPTLADCAIIVTDPAARTFTQRDAHELSEREQIVFLCGHYEGFDHRVRTQLATHAFSIGDYILTNGELPALVMADAIVRLVPGVLGSAESLAADSHADGLLSAPNYTRPEIWNGERVPDVLLSGNHQAIARWRREQSLKLTKELRPDLLAKAKLEKRDLDMLSS